MSSAKIREDSLGPLQPLQYNLALLAHLLHLAGRCDSAQRRRYLDWASEVIQEIQRHQQLLDELLQ
jgi:hypothetical protein